MCVYLVEGYSISLSFHMTVLVGIISFHSILFSYVRIFICFNFSHFIFAQCWCCSCACGVFQVGRVPSFICSYALYIVLKRSLYSARVSCFLLCHLSGWNSRANLRDAVVISFYDAFLQIMRMAWSCSSVSFLYS